MHRCVLCTPPNIIFLQTSSYSLRSIERLQVVKSQQVVHLLGNLLLRKYPNFQETDEIPVIDLLEWELWPGFLNIYGKCTKP